MEVKKCEYCDKEINFISNSMYNGIIIFCNDDCLLDYCKDYANEPQDHDYEDKRQDLD